MALETEVPFLGQQMDLPMDGSFPDFASHALDSRPHPAFDQSLGGKPSPGTPSQFLLTPSSLWDRPSFDDAAVDIFADFPEPAIEPAVEQPTQASPAIPPQQLSQQAADRTPDPCRESSRIKEESPLPPISHATRRSTRATSSGSLARNSSGPELGFTTTDASRVKKPKATTKRTSRRAKGPARSRKAPKEEIEQVPDIHDESLQISEEHLPGDSLRRNKFLERNRVAASKCRQKKKEWMHSLEETKNDLEKTHASLHETLNGLLAEISVMKEHLMMHANCGDQNIDRWFATEARKFVESKTRGDDGRRQSTSSGSGETQQSGRSSVGQSTPTSSVVPPVVPSPKVKEEPFSYDYMPDDMFADVRL